MDPSLPPRQLCEQRYLEDFPPGEYFPLPSRTMTNGIFAAFQAASADNHPVHYDEEYCRGRGMPALLAHGFQTLIQASSGAGLFPHMTEESLIGFLEQSSRFLAPVYEGDTLYPCLQTVEAKPGRTTGVLTLRATIYNQNDALVLDGIQKFLLKKRPQVQQEF
jgi:acyl dehydratase